MNPDPSWNFEYLRSHPESRLHSYFEEGFLDDELYHPGTRSHCEFTATSILWKMGYDAEYFQPVDAFHIYTRPGPYLLCFNKGDHWALIYEGTIWHSFYEEFEVTSMPWTGEWTDIWEEIKHVIVYRPPKPGETEKREQFEMFEYYTVEMTDEEWAEIEKTRESGVMEVDKQTFFTSDGMLIVDYKEKTIEVYDTSQRYIQTIDAKVLEKAEDPTTALRELLFSPC